METPSLVMVGAPHFFSNTTLRPLGPRVTRTASASWFIPDSRARRACSSNAISLGIGGVPPLASVSTQDWRVLTANHADSGFATGHRVDRERGPDRRHQRGRI